MRSHLSVIVTVMLSSLGFAAGCTLDHEGRSAPDQSAGSSDMLASDRMAGTALAGGVATVEKTFDFDTGAGDDMPPASFEPVLSMDRIGGTPSESPAAPGQWVVQSTPDAVTGERVLAQVSTDTTDGRFPMIVYPSLSLRDVDVWVHLQPISGTIDRAGGIAIRFQDENNYYVARANALEDNVRLYKMVNGERIQFAGKDVRVTPNQWHVLKLSARGPRFQVSFDGELLFEARDDTFDRAGRVGLWTKADSVTAFDNLKVEGYDER